MGGFKGTQISEIIIYYFNNRMYNFVTLMAAAVLATAVQTAEIASMGELD